MKQSVVKEFGILNVIDGAQILPGQLRCRRDPGPLLAKLPGVRAYPAPCLTVGTKQTSCPALLVSPRPGPWSWAGKQGWGGQDVGGEPLLPLYPLQPLVNQGKKEEEEEEATSGLMRFPAESRALGCQRRGPRAAEEGKQGALAWAPANLGEERESGLYWGKANKQSG